MGNATIFVGNITGSSGSPTSTNSQPYSSPTDPATITITVPTGGVALAAILNQSTIGTWSNATEDYQRTTLNGSNFCLSNTTTVGAQTPSYGGIGAEASHLVAVAFGP